MNLSGRWDLLARLERTVMFFPAINSHLCVCMCVCSDVPTTPEPQTGQPLRKRLGDLSTNVDIVPCPAPRALPADSVENRLPQSECLSAVVCLCMCALILIPKLTMFVCVFVFVRRNVYLSVHVCPFSPCAYMMIKYVICVSVFALVCFCSLSIINDSETRCHPIEVDDLLGPH